MGDEIIVVKLAGGKGAAHLPLSGHVTKTSGDAEDESIEFGKLSYLNDGVVRLRGCVHKCKNLLGECLRNSVVDKMSMKEPITR